MLFPSPIFLKSLILTQNSHFSQSQILTLTLISLVPSLSSCVVRSPSLSLCIVQSTIFSPFPDLPPCPFFSPFLVHKSDEDKIMLLDSHKLIAASREPGDRVQFTEYIQKNVALYQFRNRIPLTNAVAANFTRGKLATALRKMWAKEETDQLFDLCERFDLRFIVIADRFPSSRTVEELKGRYYSVSRAILIARNPSSGDVAVHPLVKVAEESELVVALNAGAEVIERAILGETESPSNMQLPPIVVPSSTTTDNASTLASLRILRVYLRTYALEQMVQAATSSAGLRTIKRVEQTLQELGVNLKPRVPTKAVCAEHLELRKEILTLLNLQKQFLVEVNI